MLKQPEYMCVQLEEMRKNEDPRLSFSTPEFKEAQRMFSDGFKVPARPTLLLTSAPDCLTVSAPAFCHSLATETLIALLSITAIGTICLHESKQFTAGPRTHPDCASRNTLTECLQKNFGKPVEWGMVKEHPWSTPQLRKLDTPVRLLSSKSDPPQKPGLCVIACLTTAKICASISNCMKLLVLSLMCCCTSSFCVTTSLLLHQRITILEHDGVRRRSNDTGTLR